MARECSRSAILLPWRLGDSGFGSLRGERSVLNFRSRECLRSRSDSQLRHNDSQLLSFSRQQDPSLTKDVQDDDDSTDDEVHADEPLSYKKLGRRSDSKQSYAYASLSFSYWDRAKRIWGEREHQIKLLIKCLLAYAIASMASLSPLAKVFQPGQSQHMVATVAVYFNPARSVGGMIEANVYAAAAFIFSLSVGLASMGTVLALNSIEQILLGHLITIVIWVGLSMTAIAYAKDYMSHPTFTTACSLTTIIIFLVVVKEGAVSLGIFDMERIVDVAAVVASGCIISDIICIVLWPSRAKTRVTKELIVVRSSFAESIKDLPLLLTSPEDLVAEALQSQSNRRMVLLNSLQRYIEELTWEAPNSSAHYRMILASLYRLQQYCSALRKVSLRNQGFGASFSQSIARPLEELCSTCASALHQENTHSNANWTENIAAAIRNLQQTSRTALKTLEIEYGSHGISSTDLQDQIFPLAYFVFEYCEACEEISTLLRILADSIDHVSHGNWRRIRYMDLSADKLLPTRIYDDVPTLPPIGYYIWRFGTFLSSDRSRYALKTGAGAAILASPAFFQATRPIFHEYRAEWALVSYMIVSSPTSGTTSLLALQRIMGTALGAMLAFTVWQISGNAIWLGFAGCLIALPCFWTMLFTTYSSGGRFALLAYNISALYTYNAQDRVHIGHICLARFATVIAGVMWASIVNNVIWRRQSRKVLRAHITSYLLALGFFYRQLINLASGHKTSKISLQSEVHHDSDLTVLKLQLCYTRMKAVLAEARNEPRLRGAFNSDAYNIILRRLQDTTEHLILMRGALKKSRRARIAAADASRLTHLVMNLAWTLSAAFRSKIPLPPTLTDAGVLHRDLLQSMLDSQHGLPLSDSGILSAAAILGQSQEIVGNLEEIEDIATQLFGMYAESDDYLVEGLLS